MDTYEATKVVMSRIQNIDPENASKIMGYILLQDQGEKEMIRLAFSPDSLLQSYINQAKSRLFISSSPRIIIPNNNNNGFHFSNPSSPASSAFHPNNNNNSPRPFSYAAALNNNGTTNNNNNNNNSDDSLLEHPMMSPSGRSDSLLFPYGEDSASPHSFHHRRSCSVNDAVLLANLVEEGGGGGGGGGGFGWRPCMYFARGFCKNGASCKFSHGGDVGGGGEGGVVGDVVGSPSSKNVGVCGFDEMLRIKALQQQHRFAAAMGGGGGGGGGQQHPFGYNKCMDLVNENPRNEFSPMGLIGGATSSSRQIYLTFPADSTFKEEDVSNYFSMFGPVQDVRIPYQQKRMFGFVTFVYSETVKLILAKGNPHFVCDSRVLVKPYKEKGKIPDKKQHLDRGEYSACLSPSALDSREHIDLPFGSRTLFNAQEMMLRRKLEQEAELHHAIELQGRRIMNLQLMDLKNQHNNHHFLPSLRAGIPISSPRQAQLLMNQNFIPGVSDNFNQEDSEEFDGNQESAKSPPVGVDQKLMLERTESSTNNIVGVNKPQNANDDESYLPESLEHILPDNLFASPTKLASENKSVFSQDSVANDDSIPVTISTSNNLSIASLKSCYLQMPRKESVSSIDKEVKKKVLFSSCIAKPYPQQKKKRNLCIKIIVITNTILYYF